MPLPIPSLSSSDQLAANSGVNSALGDTRAGSGLRGSFVNNFVGGKNNKLSASLDAGEAGGVSGLIPYALAAAGIVGLMLVFKKRNG